MIKICISSISVAVKLILPVRLPIPNWWRCSARLMKVMKMQPINWVWYSPSIIKAMKKWNVLRWKPLMSLFLRISIGLPNCWLWIKIMIRLSMELYLIMLLISMNTRCTLCGHVSLFIWESGMKLSSIPARLLIANIICWPVVLALFLLEWAIISICGRTTCQRRLFGKLVSP